MKRLVVAFHPRRNVPVADPDSTPPLPANPNNVYSSSSSDGSAVQTPDPDDDPDPSHPAIAPRTTSRWSNWIKQKPSLPSSLKQKQQHQHQQHQQQLLPDSDSDSDHYDEDPQPQPQPQPHLQVQPQSHSRRPLPPPSSFPRPTRRPSPSPSRPTRIPTSPALRAQMSLRAVTLSSLTPPPSPPPLLHLPAAPIFPRSVNPARALSHTQDTRTSLLKGRVLRRLEGRVLTPREDAEIAPFGARPKTGAGNPGLIPNGPGNAALHARRRGGTVLGNASTLSVSSIAGRITGAIPTGGIDDSAPLNTLSPSRASQGAARFINRPPFEVRCRLYTWDVEAGDSGRAVAGRLVERPIVAASGRAVAELEFSEWVEGLAGYIYTDLESPSHSGGMYASESYLGAYGGECGFIIIFACHIS